MSALSPPVSNQLLNKVPAVTLFFWVIKIMATTVGETAADFLNVNLHFGLTGTSIVTAVLLLLALAAQLRARSYSPPIYWITVVLLSVFGTLVTDNLVDNMGVSLEACAAFFSAALIAAFAGWYASERTLSIQRIYSTRRELFYWTAIFLTFALGTAAGDLAAEGLKLGYGVSVLLFGGLIAATAFSRHYLKLNAILAFWIAYILTRPFGASCGDLLAKPMSEGGLGLGTALTSGIFFTAIAGLVVYLTLSRNREAA